MADLNKVAVRLPFGLPGYAAGSTCSLPRSRAEALAARGLAIILNEKVEDTPVRGHSFIHKLNRITKSKTKARKKRYDERVRAEEAENQAWLDEQTKPDEE